MASDAGRPCKPGSVPYFTASASASAVGLGERPGNVIFFKDQCISLVSIFISFPYLYQVLSLQEDDQKRKMVNKIKITPLPDCN